jgi:hypothetical protein
MALTLIKPFNLDTTLAYTFTGNVNTSGNLNAGAISNVKITGGTTGQIITTDGNGVLSFSSLATLINGTSNVIVNANSNIAFSAGGTSNVLVIANTSVNVLGNLSVTGPITSSGSLTANGSLTITGNASTGNFSAITVTSLGTTTSVGQIISTVDIGTPPLSVNSTTLVANLNVANAAYALNSANIANTAMITVARLTVSGNTLLGSVSNVHITGGVSGQSLTTDGAGNLSWSTVSGGEGGGGATALSGLSDVLLNTLVDGQSLVYDSANSKWINSTVSGGGGGSLTITDDTSTDEAYYPVYATASTGSMTVAGISTTKMQFNPSSGQLTVQDLNTLSDATLKINPEQIEDPFVVLKQLFGVSFNWADTGKKSYGLLAQMLEKVLPELVNENAQGKKTVNYIPLIAFLIEAVNRQQEDIDVLKKR